MPEALGHTAHMALLNPFHMTGLVLRDNERGQTKFAGTCFALWSPSHLLTAAHCVAGAPADSLSVSIYLDNVERGLDVVHVALHPTADVAVLRIREGQGIFNPFHDVEGGHEAGDDMIAFGYPEDALETGLAPVPRMFRGHVQRVFEHRSHRGYHYVADELSMAIPAGLSGGPVFSVSTACEVSAVAAETIEASTYVRTITELKDDTREYVEKVHSVVNYGVAVRLECVLDWLRAVIQR